jgi:hypothetical protein
MLKVREFIVKIAKDFEVRQYHNSKEKINAVGQEDMYLTVGKLDRTLIVIQSLREHKSI